MKTDITKIIGYILLTPAVISVFLFIAQFAIDRYFFDSIFNNTIWTGYLKIETLAYEGGGGGGGGYTSALPFYFGLMAIAGAYLIKK